MMTDRRSELADLDQEIRDHIELETQDNIERGMAPDDARYAALRKFGNVARVKEDTHAVWLPQWIDSIRQDVRDGLRRLRRNPAFSIVVVLTLALGIGLSTVAYSVFHAVLVRPLSYPDPDRLVWLSTSDEADLIELLSAVEFIDWREQSTSLERIVAYNGSDDATMVVADQAIRVRIVWVSVGFWELTGARPALGRLPDAADRLAIVLTHRCFIDQFHGDSNIIGRPVTLNGQQVIVAAVLPEDFHPQLPTPPWRPGITRVEADAYRNLIVQPPSPSGMMMVFLALGKLRSGVSVETARADLEAIQTKSLQSRPAARNDRSTRVIPLKDRLVGEARPGLWVSLGAVVLVLLITCANVANLLLARSSARQKEIALRISIGGGPLRVVRQLIAESLVLATLGGVGGLFLALWLLAIVKQLMTHALPRLAEASIDGTVLGVAMMTSVLTAFIFGLGPALALCRTNAHEVLKAGAKTASASRGRVRGLKTVVALQLAMTVVLLCGAALMVKSLWQMNVHPPDFHPEQILTMRVDFSGPQYRQQDSRQIYVDRVLAQVGAVSGVQSVAITTGGDSWMLVLKEGERRPESRAAYEAALSAVSPDYPRMLGMRLVQGQWLDEAQPKGALINESLARRRFAGADPIGQRIQMAWVNDRSPATIVGVLQDMKHSKIDADPAPELFVNRAGAQLFGITIAVRTQADPLVIAPDLRQVVANIDRTQSVFDVKTMEQALAESIAPRRFNLFLLGTFAAAALLLAVLGIYGVVAYAVGARTQEIGIRLALGAHRHRVVRMMVREAMTSVIVGIALGIVAAIGLTRVIATMLYGVAPTDPATFGVVTATLMTIAFIACAAPALKAALIDPVIALRCD